MSKNMNFSARVSGIFDAFNTNYDAMNSLMQDLALGREIYDAETDKVISKAEANATVLDFSRQVLGITPEMIKEKDGKAIKRAFRDNKRAWYDIIEDTIDVTVNTGLQESEWFNELVEQISIEYGNRQDFVAERRSILSVALAGTSHHDHILQRLGVGQRYTIPTKRHVVKVGADINKYILGQIDWAKYISAITEAYMIDMQKEAFNGIAAAVAAIPSQSQFVGTGDLATKKADFLEITDNVSDANDGADVVIMGTKAALRKVTDVIDTDWIADAQKNSRMDSGIVGKAEGMTLVRIPNRYENDSLTTKQFSDKVLYIFASGADNKIIKFVTEGNLEINEVDEKGEQNGRWDDIMTYEVQSIYGAGVVPGYIFGQWTLP